MCLAIPGQVEELFQKDGLAMAKVNFGGVKRSTCLQYTPEAGVGDFVLVHVGFSISIINEEEAEATFEMLRLSGEVSEFKNALEFSGTAS